LTTSLYYKDIFEIKIETLSRSVALQWYHTDRNELGNNGTLRIFKCSKTAKNVIQHINSEGQLNLDADVVHEQLINGAMKGNAGEIPAFYVTLKNRKHAAGGTTINGAKDPHSCVGLRRFTFFFKHQGDLALTVYHILGKESKYFDLFYDKSSILYVNEEEGLPHEVIPATGAMEVDRISVAGLSSDDDYDYDVGGCSQLPS